MQDKYNTTELNLKAKEMLSNATSLMNGVSKSIDAIMKDMTAEQAHDFASKFEDTKKQHDKIVKDLKDLK